MPHRADRALDGEALVGAWINRSFVVLTAQGATRPVMALPASSSQSSIKDACTGPRLTPEVQEFKDKLVSGSDHVRSEGPGATATGASCSTAVQKRPTFRYDVLCQALADSLLT